MLKTECNSWLVGCITHFHCIDSYCLLQPSWQKNGTQVFGLDIWVFILAEASSLYFWDSTRYTLLTVYGRLLSQALGFPAAYTEKGESR